MLSFPISETHFNTIDCLSKQIWDGRVANVIERLSLALLDFNTLTATLVIYDRLLCFFCDATVDTGDRSASTSYNCKNWMKSDS